MKHSINKINFQKNGKTIRIDLEGKNLIIAGNNGSGKTLFLSKILNFLSTAINDPHHKSINDLYDERNIIISNINKQNNKESLNKHSFVNELGIVDSNISRLQEFNLLFDDFRSMQSEYFARRFQFKFFPAVRNASIQNDGKISSLDALSNEYISHQMSLSNLYSGTLFERYIVTLWNYALMKKGLGDDDGSNKSFNIIEGIKNDLRVLFEDESITIDFNIEKLKLFIHQDGKEPFGLDQLSSGFSSILSIYTDLLMTSELGVIPKDKMTGIVLIDEIDAHLHVTLQKKVFSFFAQSFPLIQFVITTHSPFVIQSVSDAIIFNLTTFEQMEDLSLYSYTSIIKGLLGEEVISNRLSNQVAELTDLSSNNNFNRRFYHLVGTLDNNVNFLDVRSRAVLVYAKNKLIDHGEEE